VISAGMKETGAWANPTILMAYGQGCLGEQRANSSQANHCYGIAGFEFCGLQSMPTHSDRFHQHGIFVTDVVLNRPGEPGRQHKIFRKTAVFFYADDPFVWADFPYSHPFLGELSDQTAIRAELDSMTSAHEEIGSVA